MRVFIVVCLFFGTIATAQKCTMHTSNIGYTSAYYAIDQKDTFDECCAQCAADTKCEAWTWHAKPFHTAKGDGNCLLATAATPHGPPGTNATLVSGSKHPIVPTPAPGKPTTGPTPAPIKPNPPGGKQPNIVLFLQDDQDLFLGGWNPMKQANRTVSAMGATSTNWFIHTPVCCPSRAQILSGRYFHNVRETTPSGGCMHVDEKKVNPVSFGFYLGKAGYTLGYFGKHMNSCPKLAPPGWDW
jgi:hypothetical protein